MAAPTSKNPNKNAPFAWNDTTKKWTAAEAETDSTKNAMYVQSESLASESSLSNLAMSVTNAIDEIAYNLNAAAFSEVTNITNDYIFDSIVLNFSTAEAKTITITGEDGTILWGGAVDTSTANLGYNTTAKHFNLIFDQAFNANDNITVDVTQFGSAGTMDCVLKIKQGSNTLVGNPSVTLVDPDDDTRKGEFDNKFQIPVTIDEGHHTIHHGKHFYVKDFLDISATTSNYIFITPDTTTEIHMLGEFVGEGEFEITMYEDTTVTDNGVAVPMYNRLRSSANTPTGTLYFAPTINVQGTKIWAGKVGSGRSTGGNLRASTEIIFDRNSIYQLKVTKVAGGTLWFDALFDWYEQVPE